MNELIHPDAENPLAELDNMIDRLISDGREAGLTDREIAETLRRAREELSAGSR